MPNILDNILTVKRREAADLAPRQADLRAAARDAPPARSLSAALRRGQGTVPLSSRGTVPVSSPIRVVAEIKRRSPSVGVIVDPFDPVRIAATYAAAGAEAISCLTDREFFGGSIEDLRRVRIAVPLPVLRKDFLIAPVQIYEARAAGADAVLLIAEALNPAAMEDLASLAADLGMEVLAEAHGAEALASAIACGAALVGVNNRDLATFKVDLATTERLAPLVRKAGRVLVAESGIAGVADVRRVLAAGADAILVGEALLRSPDIAAKIAEFKCA